MTSTKLFYFQNSTDVFEVTPGMINRGNWELGPGGDDLLKPPFMGPDVARKPFNQLFAGIYDVFFGKMTRMDRVVAMASRCPGVIQGENIRN